MLSSSDPDEKQSNKIENKIALYTDLNNEYEVDPLVVSGEREKGIMISRTF